MILRKLQRAHHNLRGHFAPAYLFGSNKLRAYLFFIYDGDALERIFKETLILVPAQTLDRQN